MNERLACYEQNLNDREIGEALGYTPQTIYAWRKKHGLKARNHRMDKMQQRLELYQAGCDDNEICQRLNYAMGTIKKWRYRNNLKPNPPKHAAKMELYKQGLVDHVIAEMLGYESGDAIYRWRRSQGLPANGRK